MAVDQTDQAHQSAHASDSTILCDGSGPTFTGTAQITGSLEPIIQIGLETALAAANAPRVGELAWLQPAVHLDLFQNPISAFGEDPNLTTIEADPHFLP